MDEVLSRNLFKQRYLELQQPKQSTKGGLLSIQKFQTGGEVFTENEKLGYMALPIAAQLLQGTQRPGQSNIRGLFSDIGKGLEQVPPIALKLAELSSKKKTKQLRPLTVEEKIIYKYDPKDEVLGTYEGGALTGIAKETFKIGDAKKAVLDEFVKAKIGTADEALAQLESLMKQTGGGDIPGVGPVAGRLPEMAISEQGKQLRASYNQFVNLTLREISGAAVTESERENFLKQYGGGQAASSEQTFKKALYDARQLIEKGKERILATMDKRAVADLIDSGGVVLREPPVILKAAAGALRPQSAGTNSFNLPNGGTIKKIGDVVVIYDPKIGSYKTTTTYAKLNKGVKK